MSRLRKIGFFVTIVSLVSMASAPVVACNPYMSVDSPHFDILMSQHISTDQDSGLSKEQFDQVMARTHEVYDPIFRKRGGELVFPESNWEQTAVNGTVRRDGSKWEVLVYGGYARHQLATVDALVFLVCHEIGHHLGETAYYSGTYHWAAAEGQADYYSTLKCMRHMLEGEDNEQAVKTLNVPALVQKKCAEQFKSHEENLICQRGAMAGFAMTQIWADGQGSFKFDTPSKAVVSQTSISHPEHQCRIDTYLQGALCEMDKRIDLSSKDYNVGTCTIAQRHPIGLRPTCWFKEPVKGKDSI